MIHLLPKHYLVLDSFKRAYFDDRYVDIAATYGEGEADHLADIEETYLAIHAVLDYITLLEQENDELRREREKGQTA